MKTQKLGTSNLQLTKIGLGTWAIGGGNWQYAWGPQDETKSIDTILCAIDLGINWIDTAPVYGLGTAEKVVGRAYQQCSKKPIIATKCGLVWDDKGNIAGCLTKQSVRKEIEDSLRRLDVDVIDLYQIHWPIPQKDIEQAWEEIAKLQQEQKIRYAGVSNFNIEQLERISKIMEPVSFQPPYSMLERSIETKVLDYCDKNNIGVISYSPMQKGLLTSKMTKERIENLPLDDHRRTDKHFKEPVLSKNLELVEKLKPIAKKMNITLAQLSVAWVLQNKSITSAIVGARSPEQIKETIKASEIVLSEEKKQCLASIFL